ncbi:MAG: hypothetical protein IJH40_09565 [Ruminococcus sp.]|nr:hypothetical protein [Ruminococcus sp.]
MISYRLYTEQKLDRENGVYGTYGISVCRGFSVIRVIEDISLDKDKVISLIDTFNKEHLSPAHLDEAIENFLYDFEV